MQTKDQEITVTELIATLQEIRQQGYGDWRVGISLECHLSSRPPDVNADNKTIEFEPIWCK
ncbi:MAG: hypothetical protein Q8Q50_04800 [Methylobacter sp.]|nr:hypothetical protein [Methylobacter sp.]